MLFAVVYLVSIRCQVLFDEKTLAIMCCSGVGYISETDWKDA